MQVSNLGHGCGCCSFGQSEVEMLLVHLCALDSEPTEVHQCTNSISLRCTFEPYFGGCKFAPQGVLPLYQTFAPQGVLNCTHKGSHLHPSLGCRQAPHFGGSRLHPWGCCYFINRMHPCGCRFQPFFLSVYSIDLEKTTQLQMHCLESHTLRLIGLASNSGGRQPPSP